VRRLGRDGRETAIGGETEQSGSVSAHHLLQIGAVEPVAHESEAGGRVPMRIVAGVDELPRSEGVRRAAKRLPVEVGSVRVQAPQLVAVETAREPGGGRAEARIHDAECGMAVEHARPDEIECGDPRIEPGSERGGMEEDRHSQLADPPVDRLAAERGDRLPVDVRGDADAAQAERPHRVVEGLDRRLAVLHRQQREPVVAAGMGALELGLFLVQPHRQLASAPRREMVHIEATHARDDGVDPVGGTALEVRVDLVLRREYAAAAATGGAQDVAAAQSLRPRELDSLHVGLEVGPRVEVNLAVHDEHRREPTPTSSGVRFVVTPTTKSFVVRRAAD